MHAVRSDGRLTGHPVVVHLLLLNIQSTSVASQQTTEEWTLDTVILNVYTGQKAEGKMRFERSAGGAAQRDNQITSMCVVWSGIFVACNRVTAEITKSTRNGGVYRLGWAGRQAV